MSFQSVMFNIGATINDYKRDKAIPLPESITQCRNISYGSHGKWNLLDVYYPDGTSAPLPTIVSIHGGGYVYPHDLCVFKEKCQQCIIIADPPLLRTVPGDSDPYCSGSKGRVVQSVADVFCFFAVLAENRRTGGSWKCRQGCPFFCYNSIYCFVTE